MLNLEATIRYRSDNHIQKSDTFNKIQRKPKPHILNELKFKTFSGLKTPNF